MKKKIYKNLLISSLICIFTSSPIFAQNKINTSIKYNNLIQPIKTSIINKNNYILVAFKDLFNIIGAEIRWDEVFRSVTAKFNENELIIYVGTKKAFLNKKELEMPIEAEIINGNTYIPLRFVFENLGYKVEWIEENKEILISNEYGEYIFLNEYENKKNALSLDEALKKAKQNSSNLKNLKDSISYTQNVRENIQQEVNKETNPFPNINISLPIDNSLEISKKINSTDNLIKNKKINKTIIEDNIEVSLISSIIAIRNSELNIDILEKTINLEKLNIKNLEAKFEYGTIAEKTLNNAKENLKNLELNLDSLNNTLENQKNNLKDIIGTSKNIDININLEAQFKDLEKIDLEHYINTKKSNDLSIQIIENDINTAEYQLNNSPDVSSVEKERLQNNINIEKRKLNDTKSNLDKKIRKAYSSLEKMAKSEKTLKLSLENAISNYNITASNYNSGNSTIYQLEKAKLDILKAEKDIEENKLNFYSLMYSFYKPYLL